MLIAAVLMMLHLPTCPAGGHEPGTALRKGEHAVAEDTVPHQTLPGFPFTRDEYRRALLLIDPPEVADLLTAALFDQEPSRIGVTIMDGDLLLLTALSDEMALRVVAFRPSLREMVRTVRADPAAFVAEIRKQHGAD
jgi:hypothetical protein